MERIVELAGVSDKADASIDEPDIADLLGIRGGFRRSIAGDDELVEALVDELEQRGIRHPAQIALIHEAGNPYAGQFAAMICEALEDSDRDNCRRCLQRYGYARKLDGVLPGGELAAEQADWLARLSEGSIANPLEQPRMAHQLDYLRRLASTLGSAASGPASDAGGQCTAAPLRAAGIITPDIYDKRLILRAMRPELPGVIFFTTDLDAAFLSSADFRWQRNLLIAASGPLSTDIKIEDNKLFPNAVISAPPFRDSYQTSYQRAIELVLSRNSEDSVTENSDKNGQGNDHRADQNEVELIEVGKSGPVSIAGTSRLQAGRKCGFSLRERCDFGILQIRPALDATAGSSTSRNGALPDRIVDWLVETIVSKIPDQLAAWIVLFIPTLLMVSLYKRRRPDLEFLAENRITGFNRQHKKAFSLAVGLLVAAMLLLLGYAAYFEPIYLFEGISAVPGLMIRGQVMACGALLLLLVLLVNRRYMHEAGEYAGRWSGTSLATDAMDAADDTLSDLATPDVADPHAEQKSLRGRLRRMLKVFRGIPIDAHEFDFPEYCACTERRFSEVWDAYRDNGRVERQLARASLVGIIAVVLALMLGDLGNFRGYAAKEFTLPLWIFTYGGLFVVAAAITVSVDELVMLKRTVVDITYREPVLPVDAKVRNGLDGPAGNLLGLIRLVGYLSQIGYRALLMPVILLFLYALSFARLFEGWPWPTALTIILVLAAIVLFWSAFSLLRAATSMRRRYVMKLRHCRFDQSETADDIDAIEAGMLAVTQGVFRPAWQNPVIGLVLFQIALATILWLAAGVYV